MLSFYLLFFSFFFNLIPYYFLFLTNSAATLKPTLNSFIFPSYFNNTGCLTTCFTFTLPDGVNMEDTIRTMDAGPNILANSRTLLNRRTSHKTGATFVFRLYPPLLFFFDEDDVDEVDDVDDDEDELLVVVKLDSSLAVVVVVDDDGCTLACLLLFSAAAASKYGLRSALVNAFHASVIADVVNFIEPSFPPPPPLFPFFFFFLLFFVFCLA
jgi:hypothetical protein